MAYADRGGGAPDDQTCRYGASRMLFRGPQRNLQGRYIAVLGGTETYGKFIPEPFAALMEQALGLPVVNLGAVNGGLDLYLNEAAVLEVAAGAAICVVQIIGAQNLSNRFYSVHPRRNDRFVMARPELRQLFPEVDFTEFSFTRHLLTVLQRVSAERAERVVTELRQVWLERMSLLLSHLHKPVLLWLSDQPPPDLARIGHDPWIVDAAMITAMRLRAAEVVEVVVNPADFDSRVSLRAGGRLEQPSLLGLPGPEAHRLAARALVPVLHRHLVM